MAAFGWVLGQLLADLTIDFIPAIGMKKALELRWWFSTQTEGETDPVCT